MPNPGELIGELIRVVGEVLNASSLRLGVAPTLAVLGVLLVLLQLVARPITRWQTRDPGGLAAVAHAMALAAEAGTGAMVSLGTAGLARATSSAARLQTLVALPILGHLARAAARGGVPLEITVNDPLAGVAAAAALEDAHRRTATIERSGRSRVTYVGEGRGTAAGMALVGREAEVAPYVAGGLGEEAILILRGMGETGARTGATAEVAQIGSVLVAAEGTLIGPELFGASAELRAAGAERVVARAATRLLVIGIVILLVGTILALAAGLDVPGFLRGTG